MPEWKLIHFNVEGGALQKYVTIKFLDFIVHLSHSKQFHCKTMCIIPILTVLRDYENCGDRFFSLQFLLNPPWRFCPVKQTDLLGCVLVHTSKVGWGHNICQRLYVRPSVRRLRFPSILRRTHGRNGPKCMYPGCLQKRLDFGQYWPISVSVFWWPKIQWQGHFYAVVFFKWQL